MIHEKPVERTPEEQEAEKKFIAAGHKPQNPNCDHKQYDPVKHGRYCPCGSVMWDAGD